MGSVRVPRIMVKLHLKQWYKRYIEQLAVGDEEIGLGNYTN